MVHVHHNLASLYSYHLDIAFCTVGHKFLLSVTQLMTVLVCVISVLSIV
jgi:hypothetical protein